MTTVVLTGGSRGIGAALTRHFASQGTFRVLLCARRPPEDDIGGLIAAHPTDLSFHQCDLECADQISGLVDFARGFLGAPDVLINNAATPGPVSNLKDVSIEDYESCLSTNLMAAVRLTQAFLPGMKRRNSGKIINVGGAGVGWKNGGVRTNSYFVSKAALMGFTEALAREVADWNIQVNAVLPGPVDTSLRAQLLEETEEGASEGSQDLSPDATVRAVSFLCSPEGEGLTGRLLSGRWDDLCELSSRSEEFSTGSFGTLRRIDGRNFVESDG